MKVSPGSEGIDPLPYGGQRKACLSPISMEKHENVSVSEDIEMSFTNHLWVNIRGGRIA